MEVSKGTRGLAEGWREETMETGETEGDMIRRVMPDLMGMKNVLVINDEAHHCYRKKPDAAEDDDLKGDEKDEAKKNTEAARLWISGIEIVKRVLGVARVFDLSATPFFLSGSGYAEGTLFPWTMSDFSLMDAIECGIVKLPRVPIADNIPGSEMPMYRDLWKHIGKAMPKKGRGKGEFLDPDSLPTRLKTALEALYGHYETVFKEWQAKSIKVPPCFIIVCQNTAISKLVYDYVSGFHRVDENGASVVQQGRLALFDNFDEHGNALARPNTLLIDSEQLEAGDALDANFRAMAGPEIEQFRQAMVERSGAQVDAEKITDQELLREVMNTVGKPDQLGGSIRCVVSVSMLTEGWDANTVTHILGIRAFGTQLLCEQVIGRALRRRSYELIEDGENKGLFPVEYADIFGIPFDFAAEPVIAKVTEPKEVVQVKAMRPERDSLEIQFPRVQGYRVELPEERLEAEFNDDHTFTITPELIGAASVVNSGIIGETVDMNLKHLNDVRHSTVIMELTVRLMTTKWRDPGENTKTHLFGQLKRIVKQWLESHLICKGGTYPAHLKYRELADIACEKITAGITQKFLGDSPIKALLDPYNPTGSTAHVRFNTSREDRWPTAADKCHVNWVVWDSEWEAEFCRVVEMHPKVIAYVKNHSLGFEVPYLMGGESKRYRPDFIVLVDDGHGDPLRLIIEIKGYRGEDAKAKKMTMDTDWVPGVNHLGTYGRWAFAEFTDIWEIEADFKAKVEAKFGKMVNRVVFDKDGD